MNPAEYKEATKHNNNYRKGHQGCNTLYVIGWLIILAAALCFLGLFVPIEYAEGKALTQCSVPKPAIKEVMQYKDLATRLDKKLMNYVANMYRNQLSHYEVHRPIILLSLAAKESAGNRRLVNGNKVGLLQIEGYGPLQKYVDVYGHTIDNNSHWKKPRRNLIEGIMMLDRITLEFFSKTRNAWETDDDLKEIAGIFHCSGNRFDIRYDCPDKTEWQNNWFDCWIMPTTAAYNK